MNTDQELWACASTVLEQHGDHAPAFVAERIGALAVAGDQAGVDIWKAIAIRMGQFMRQQSETQ